MHAIWQYLRNRQPPVIMFFHLAILLLVLSQILVSNFMGFTRAGQIGGGVLVFYGTWTHIITGLTLLPVALLFAVLVLREHNLRYFFPYIFGDFKQVKSDLAALKNLRLPEPEAGGLAAVVKGLGLGALLLTLLAGLIWFLAWRQNAVWTHNAKEIHEFFAQIVELYIVGHGGMGLLHIYLTARKRQNA